MKHTGLTITALALFLISFMPLARAQDDAPKSFRINNIRSNGTGCPIGTVATNISDDQQAFTLSFSEFFAEVGPTLGRQQERKVCKVIFDTEQDVGWEYAILAVTYRGFAGLDAGVQGKQKLRFGGLGKEVDATLDLNGPLDDDYINTQEVPLSGLKWSGCKDNKQKDFTIDAVISLQAPNTTTRGLLTVDTADGEIRQEYEVLWRDCANPKKSYAVCRLAVPVKKSVRQLLSKAQAKTDALALTKARTKMAKKCEKLGNRAPGCNASNAVCSLISL